MDLYVLGTVNTAMLKMKEDVPSVNVVCIQSTDFVVICPFNLKSLIPKIIMFHHVLLAII